MKNLEELKPEEIKFEITSNEDLTRLNLVLRRIKQSKDKICEKLDPEIANAYKTHKGLTALKKETLKPWEEVETKINNSIKAWHIKQEEEARLLQERINKQLSEQAEALRQQKLKEADEKGSDWSKEIAKEEVKNIVTDTIDLKACKEAVIQKQEGQYKRSNWKAEIIDSNKVPKEFWTIDLQALDVYAKKTKGTIPVEGVRFYDDFTIVTKI